MKALLSALRGLAFCVRSGAAFLWRKFRVLPRWGQAVVIALIIAVIIGINALLGAGAPQSTGNAMRTVTLRSVAELSGGVSGESVVGTVRSRSEAEMRAEASGTVRSVNTSIGAAVPAGFVIAELENDSERAQVTQAEGAYDAAVAARASVSPAEVEIAARNAYRDAFTDLDTTLEAQVDAFFGARTPAGPDLLINPIGTDPTKLQRERDRIDRVMQEWRDALPLASAKNPSILLLEAESASREVSAFVDVLSENAYASGSDATPAQLTAIAAARAGVNGVLSSLSAARTTFQSNETTSTASVDASVKSALGTLRLAQASLEKTRVRAPIAGTVNFLPIRVGDYVGNLDHVATVAQNGALEIVASVSEEAGTLLTAGSDVMVEGEYPGTITSVSPALDPVTKQIEVRVAVDAGSGLVNGQSVRVTLPGIAPSPEAAAGPILLPLSSVKLSAGNRVVFTMDGEGRLAALPVEIGEVRGERIEIVSGLRGDERVVTDARGLSAGQQVKIADE